jgi:flagellin
MNLAQNSQFQQQTIQQLTSGYRINQSGDDAAGLAVANQYRSNIAELTQGVLNANDGVSALQIADGGLNNITTMLDRLKTLATQASSSAFTGNRANVNVEYQQLVQDISRQAANVGLNNGGRFNTNNTVYIGGGSSATNAQVSVNLSGAQNAVDSDSLGLSKTSVLGGGTALDGIAGTSNTVRIDTPGAVFLQGGSQSFGFDLINNGVEESVSANVVDTNGGNGITLGTALGQLNSQLQQYGITANVGTNGQLNFSGATAFTVNASTVIGTGGALATAGSGAANEDNYSLTQGTYTAPSLTATQTETLTFTNAQGSVTVNVAKTDTAQNVIDNINAAAGSIGIHAVHDLGGSGFTIQSASSFNASDVLTDTAGAGSTSPGTVLAGLSVTAPSSSNSATGNALAAINAINTALQQVGNVQSAVGAGQNKLNYAISLANSQIENFSAAQSRIRDADVAAEAANLSKAQVLNQASVAAMAQANQAPQILLKLLQ